MSITEKEQKEFNNMVTACGRSPGDFRVTSNESKDGAAKVVVENLRLGRRREYVKDNSNTWIIKFATDLKLGDM